MESNPDDKAVIGGFEILMKLIGNILNTPQDEKFRILKKSNKAIQTKLLSLKGIPELIKALGYTDVDEESYVFIGDYFVVLRKGRELIENTHLSLRRKYMTPEELKK